jgi:hypothetical protein
MVEFDKEKNLTIEYACAVDEAVRDLGLSDREYCRDS